MRLDGRRSSAVVLATGGLGLAALVLSALTQGAATAAPHAAARFAPPQPSTSAPAPTVLAPVPLPSSPPTAGPTTSSTSGRPSRHAGRVREDVGTQVRIEHCQDSSPKVWLTFDDGGSPAQVHRILRVLRAEDVRAIFFPIGSWAAGHRGLVRQLGRQGHLVGDHTWSHADLARVPSGTAEREVARGRQHGPGAVPLLRPPFGAGAYTQRVDDLAAAQGLTLCTWTVDTRDWTGRSARAIVRAVAHGDAVTPPVRRGGVVIMHMNGDHTGQALPGVIRAVRARGLSLHRLR